MTDKIKHLGIVESINGSYLKVRIVQTSACSACSIKGHCSAAESKEKLIDVYNKSGLSGREPGHDKRSDIPGNESCNVGFCFPFCGVARFSFCRYVFYGRG